MVFLGDEIMTKTVSVLAVAFLAVVALTVADKAQENPSIIDEATTCVQQSKACSSKAEARTYLLPGLL